MHRFRVFAGPRALLRDVLYGSFVRTNTISKDPTRLGMEIAIRGRLRLSPIRNIL